MNAKGNHRAINTACVVQKRVFLTPKNRHGTYLGGRFYSGFWQSISEDERQSTTINGEPVGEELDYDFLHPQLAYAMKGCDVIDEPYNIENPLAETYSQKCGGKWLNRLF